MPRDIRSLTIEAIIILMLVVIPLSIGLAIGDWIVRGVRWLWSLI